MVLYDATGAAVRFAKESDGSLTTPKGYSKDLKKNADGTYTLTDRKSGSKDTSNADGTLTEVTDKNKGAITVTQHDQGGEHKGFKLTETRSGRGVDLVRTYPNQWQAKDHTGRTAVFDLNAAGDLEKTTDAEGKSTVFGYDSSRRLTKITTHEGRVRNRGKRARGSRSSCSSMSRRNNVVMGEALRPVVTSPRRR